MCVCVCVCVCVSVCVCVCVCMSICNIYVCMTHTHIYIYIYVCNAEVQSSPYNPKSDTHGTNVRLTLSATNATCEHATGTATTQTTSTPNDHPEIVLMLPGTNYFKFWEKYSPSSLYICIVTGH